MSKAKIIIPVLLIACGIAILILLPHRPIGREQTPILAGRVVLYGYADDGTLVWETSAEEGRIEEDAEELTGVTIRFHQEDGTDLIISAPSLVQQNGIRRLTGGVRVERGDDLRMKTDSLVWNDDADTLSASSVELTYGKFEASGNGFRYDLSDGRSSLSNGVEGRIEREGEISVRGERAEEADGRIVIEGEVIVESDKKTYRCGRLESNSAGEDILLSGGVTGSLPEGQLSGNTMRIDQDGISVSGSVVLDLSLEERNGA